MTRESTPSCLCEKVRHRQSKEAQRLQFCIESGSVGVARGGSDRPIHTTQELVGARSWRFERRRLRRRQRARVLSSDGGTSRAAFCADLVDLGRFRHYCRWAEGRLSCFGNPLKSPNSDSRRHLIGPPLAARQAGTSACQTPPARGWDPG